MLESSSLLIHPWQHREADPDEWVRPIADGPTTAPLGSVRLLGPPNRSWFSWLRGQRLEVLETEDAALLMTLVRPWGLARGWEIHDAEERCIGFIYQPELLDSEGGRRAFIDFAKSGGYILGPTSHVLAEFARRADRTTELRFASDLEANPFLRMLLLGGVIVQEPDVTKSSR